MVLLRAAPADRHRGLIGPIFGVLSSRRCKSSRTSCLTAPPTSPLLGSSATSSGSVVHSDVEVSTASYAWDAPVDGLRAGWRRSSVWRRSDDDDVGLRRQRAGLPLECRAADSPRRAGSGTRDDPEPRARACSAACHRAPGSRRAPAGIHVSRPTWHRPGGAHGQPDRAPVRVVERCAPATSGERHHAPVLEQDVRLQVRDASRGQRPPSDVEEVRAEPASPVRRDGYGQFAVSVRQHE